MDAGSIAILRLAGKNGLVRSPSAQMPAFRLRTARECLRLSAICLVRSSSAQMPAFRLRTARECLRLSAICLVRSPSAEMPASRLRTAARMPEAFGYMSRPQSLRSNACLQTTDSSEVYNLFKMYKTVIINYSRVDTFCSRIIVIN
jgi:hypothetical protein